MARRAAEVAEHQRLLDERKAEEVRLRQRRAEEEERKLAQEERYGTLQARDRICSSTVPHAVSSWRSAPVTAPAHASSRRAERVRAGHDVQGGCDDAFGHGGRHGLRHVCGKHACDLGHRTCWLQ